MKVHLRLIALARDSQLPLIIGILGGLLAGLAGLVQAYAISSTVDGVFLDHRTLAQVWGWLTLLLGAAISRGLLVWTNEVASQETSVRVKSALRGRIFRQLAALGPAYCRGERTGELVTAATQGIEALDAYFGQYLPQLVISVLVPVSILLVVFPLDIISGLILLLTAPLIPFFMWMIGRSAQTATQRQYETLGRLASHFLDSLQGLTTLKLFSQSKAQITNVRRVCDQFRETTLRVLQVSFLSAFALELLATVSTAIIAVEVGLRLLYGQLPFREALFLLILAPEFYLPLRLLGARFHAGMAGTAAARRLFQILDEPARALSPLLTRCSGEGTASAAAARVSDHTERFAIELVDVSYTYAGRAMPALDGLSLRIGAGQHVALVGASGAGKTTLTSILLRFIQPSRGRILINGQPLDTIDPDAYHGLIAWVPQNPHLFHDSIGANIRLGKPNASADEVAQAARVAHLDTFIESLPEKYETPVGEGGTRLSSGQAQRLALARAFLVDAPCLILDEPGASLDPENEAMLRDSVRELARGRTVITIAHRLRAMCEFDQILVLDAGRLVERGTHSELLSRNGAYARLAGATSVLTARDAEVDRRSPSARVEDLLPGLAVAGPVAPTAAIWIREVQPGGTAAIAGEASIAGRLLRFAKGEWHRVWLSVLLGSLTIGSSLGLMGASAWLISTAALHPSIAALAVAIVGVRLFGIARAGFRYLERLASHSVTFRLLRKIRVWFYERLEPLAPACLMDRGAGDLLARATWDVETLENMYARLLAPPCTALVIAVGCMIFFALSGLMSLALLVAACFVMGGLMLPILIRLLSRQAGSDLVLSRAAIHTALVDDIQGLADILAFGRARDRLRAIDDLSCGNAEAQRRMARVGGLQAGMSILLPHVALCLALALAIPRMTAGAIDGVMLGPVALVTLAAFEAVLPLPAAAQLWPATREAARRLFEIADTRPAVREDVGEGAATIQAGRAVPSGSQPPESDLEFRDLTFQYPGTQTPALKHVSFRLDANARFGIVGPSGAGKSSLAYLALRFWEYAYGEICLNGVSLRSISPEQVRARIGYVSTHAHFFDTTIYENLRLARRGATRPEIQHAAMEAQIHDFVCSLPQGYDTMIGEHGFRLSAGERQRMSVARLLIKDAPLWILDEPTAHLDPVNEARVLANLFRIMQSKTVLFITHRLVGLENLDQILVMEQGMIVQRGSHDELAAGPGLYGRLRDMQVDGPAAGA